MKANIATVLLVLCLAACQKDQRQTIRLSSRERQVVDTLYAAQLEPIRTRLDSLCEADFERSVQVAVDSIMAIRRLEEERLRARMQQLLKEQGE